jgi:hypothetical protein
LKPKSTELATQRTVRILDANYKKADLPEVVKTCTHLSQNEQNELLEVLWEFEDLFDGTLGDWNTKPVSFELRRDAKPYHSRAFPIPKVHRETCYTVLLESEAMAEIKKVRRKIKDWLREFGGEDGDLDPDDKRYIQRHLDKNEDVGAFMADLAGRRSVLFPKPRSSGKLVDMRSSERRDFCVRFWSGRLFLMFCSCFEVDND